MEKQRTVAASAEEPVVASGVASDVRDEDELNCYRSKVL